MKELIRSEVQGLEKYVAGKPINEVKRELGIDRVVKMASNENPYGCSPKVKETIKNLVEETYLYPDAASFEFKDTLAKELNIEREMIFCGAGSDSLIKDICATFINQGDESIMADITFPRYKSNTLLMGGNPIEIPLKDYKLDIVKMVEAITEKTKIIWFCNPNNPTGTIFTKGEFEAVLSKIPSNVIIIMDEAYVEFVDKEIDFPNSIDLLDKYKNMIVLRTFSKAYGLASLRFGYGIASTEIVEYLNRVINPFDSNLFAQKSAVEALKDKEHLEYVVKNNRLQKEYLQKEFKKLGLNYIETQANFIMVDVNCDDKKLNEYLLKKGFIIRPGYLLGIPRFLRISIGLERENKEFMQHLETGLRNLI